MPIFTYENSIFGNTTLEKNQVLKLIETPASEYGAGDDVKDHDADNEDSDDDHPHLRALVPETPLEVVKPHLPLPIMNMIIIITI